MKVVCLTILQESRVISGAKSMLASDSTSYRWYGLYARGKEFATDYVQGSMIWGNQYDAIMNWMLERNIDVTSGAPTTPEGTKVRNNSSRITGSKTEDKLNNIFDLLGNSSEMTLEASRTVGRAGRGGNHRYGDSPSYRYDDSAPVADSSDSLRPTLYIR